MIKIKLSKDKSRIEKIRVENHAGYAEYGRDIVCSSISVLTFTLIEAMDGVLKLKEDQYSYKIDEDQALIELEIYYDKLNRDQRLLAQGLVDSFALGVLRVSQAYKGFVKIEQREV